MLLEWGVFLAVCLIVLYVYNRGPPKGVFQKMYFDNNGTTEPRVEVLDAMREAAYMGNPSSDYSDVATNRIGELKAEIHKWTGTNSETHEIIINSGASEGNNFIIRSVVDKHRHHEVRPHVIISATEHKTSIGCVDQLVKLGRCTATYIVPNISGQISAEDVSRAITPETVLITVMHANNEIGNKNDLYLIGQEAARRGITFHSDVVQTFGKYAIPMTSCNLSAITMSFHKMYGPNGIGVVVLQKGLADKLEAQISGSQNMGLRGGTENMQAVSGALVAMRLTLLDRPTKNEKLRSMKRSIVNCLQSHFNIDKFADYYDRDDDTIPNIVGTKPFSVVFLGPVTGGGLPIEIEPDTDSRAGSLPNTLLISFMKQPTQEELEGKKKYDNFCNLKLKKELKNHGVIVSIGSACNTKETGPSHVLRAIRAPYIIRCGVIRITLGDNNTLSQTSQLCRILTDCVHKQL